MRIRVEVAAFGDRYACLVRVVGRGWHGTLVAQVHLGGQIVCCVVSVCGGLIVIWLVARTFVIDDVESLLNAWQQLHIGLKMTLGLQATLFLMRLGLRL